MVPLDTHWWECLRWKLTCCALTLAITGTAIIFILHIIPQRTHLSIATHHVATIYIGKQSQSAQTDKAVLCYAELQWVQLCQKLKRKVVFSGISALSLSGDRARNYFPMVFLQRASSSKRPLQRGTLNLHSAVFSPQLCTRIKGEAEATVLCQWYRKAESDNSL